MALFRLSISLPDRPGSLGLLASAIGASGGDIRGLVVLKSEDGRGYDDITVAVPGSDPTRFTQCFKCNWRSRSNFNYPR